MRSTLINYCLSLITAFFSWQQSSAFGRFPMNGRNYQPASRLFVSSQKNTVENMAQTLLDMNKSKQTFDFCGGMMFQLELTDALVNYLKTAKQPPVVHKEMRMSQVPGYGRSAFADNIRFFHGREIRNVPHAKGGMGMVLQLSLAADSNNNRIDPQGWSTQEMQTYDGWGSDRGRVWRSGSDYEGEGFDCFRQKYGEKSYGLNHRFYLHQDFQGKLWLSAEDGCEGTPVDAPQSPLQSILSRFS